MSKLTRQHRAPKKRWNLLLVVPFLTLATPLFNTVEPRLFGIPFFYWSQLAWVVVGVGCVLVVNMISGGHPAGNAPEELR